MNHLSEKQAQHKNIALVLTGRLISGFGDRLLDYANITQIASLGSSSQMLLGGYQIAESVTSILLNTIGGAVADRCNRKKILIISDCCAAFVCLLLALCYPTNYLAYAMIMANVALAVVNAFSSPAYRSVIPQLVTRDYIIRLNSTLELVNQLLSFTSPVISLLIIRRWGSVTALLIDTVTFLISAMLTAALSILDGKNDATESCTVEGDDSAANQDIKKVLHGLFSDIREGISFILHQRVVLTLLIVSSTVNIFLSLYNLALPYVGIAFHGGKAAYAMALACEAIGGIIGSLIGSAGKLPCTYYSLVVTLGLCGLSLIMTAPLYAMTASIIPVFACIILFNTTLTLYNIFFFSLIQINVIDQLLGRVFSVIFTIAVLFMPLGTAVFSIAINAKSVLCFLFSGMGIMAVVLFTACYKKYSKDIWG